MKSLKQKHFSAFENLYEYLEETLIASKSLTIKQTKEVFLKALKDYFNGKIDLKCLATIATRLYFHFYKPHEIDSLDRELGEALSIATEIDWDFENRTKSEFDQKIKVLRDYYGKNISRTQNN